MKHKFKFFLFGLIFLGGGLLHAFYDIPELLSNHPFLKGLEQKMNQYQEFHQNEKVYLHTDRKFYEPGEDIWFKAYVRDSKTLEKSAKSGIVYVELLDPKGTVIENRRMLLKQGSVAGDFKLTETASGGLYKIKAYTNWQKNTEDYFSCAIQVQKVVLPNLKMALQFARKAYGPEDKVIAQLDLHSLTKEALAKHAIEYKVYLEGELLETKGSKTDMEGRAYLEFILPKELNSNDGLLHVALQYKGQTESISRSIPISLGNIDVQFFPEGGDLVAGLSNNIGFKALDEFGKPADVVGEVLDPSGNVVLSFESYHQGMGVFPFTPIENEKYQVKIKRPLNAKGIFDIPKAEKEAYALRVLEQTNEGIKIEILTNLHHKAFLVARGRDEILFSQEIEVQMGSNWVNIPSQDFPIGITQITLFDDKKTAQAERLVFVNAHKKLKIDIQTEKEKYLPREEVKMNILVQDENGKPVQGNFSLAIVDDKLKSFADDKQAHILASMLLTDDLKGKVEEPNFYFDDENDPNRDFPTINRRKALDHLLLTQGWRKFSWESIRNEERVLMEFSPEGKMIAGKILNLQGEAIPGALVEIVDENLKTKTDEKGYFVFSNLEIDQSVTLRAEANNYNANIWKVKEFANDLHLELNEEKWVFGVLANPKTGAGIPSMQVRAGANNVFCDYYGRFMLLESAGLKELEINSINGQPNHEYKNINYKEFRNGDTIWLQDMETLWLKDKNIWAHSARKYLEERGMDLSNKKMSIESLKKEYDKTKQLIMVTEEIRDMVVEIDEVDMAVGGREMPVIEELLLGPDPEEPLIIDKNIEEPKKEEAPPEEPVVVDPEPILAVEAELLWDRNDGGGAPMEDFWAEEPMYYTPEVSTIALLRGSDDEKLSREKILSVLYHKIAYPKEAKQAGVTSGSATVRFAVDMYGHPIGLQIIENTNSYFGDALLNAISTIPTFNPAFLNGKPVPSSYEVRIAFDVNKSSQTLLKSANLNKSIWSLTKSVYGRQNMPYDQTRVFYSPKYADESIPAIRTDFRNTIYWNPNVETDKLGKASLTFHNSDAITEFRVTMEGFGTGGSLGHGEYSYFTQMPFEMFCKVPEEVLTGDVLKIPLSLSNNSEKKVKGKLNVSPPANFELIKVPAGELVLEAEESKTLYLEYKVSDKTMTGNFEISFQSGSLKDGLAVQIKTKSRGFPVHEVFTGSKLKERYSLQIKEPLNNSVKAELKVYANVLDEVMGGMESMLRMPSGCFEQTSSSNYPNLLVLSYLKETNTSNTKIEAQAMSYLETGYKRLTGYESPKGGFHWWGYDPGHEALTAYGLMQFVDMKTVYSVDEEMIDRTAKWLLSRRDNKGGWQKNLNALHTWANAAVTDAYIVWALSEAGYGSEIKKELEKSYDDALRSEDPYMMALLANALYDTNPEKAKGLVKEIAKMQKSDGSFMGLSASVVNSTGNSLLVETSSLVALSMMKVGGYATIVSKTMMAIQNGKNYYGYGSTQGTVLALKAILTHAKNSKKMTENGELVLLVNGKEVKRLAYEVGDHIGIVNLEKYLKKGKQQIEVRYEKTKEPMPFDIQLSYTTSLPVNAKDCKLSLETKLKTNTISMGEIVRLSTNLENKAEESVSMAMVMLGIPAGLSLQPWQLKELQEKGIVDYYEIFDGYVVFHFERLEGEAKKQIDLDLKADIPGTYEAPASTAFLYYTQEDRVWAQAEHILIQ